MAITRLTHEQQAVVAHRNGHARVIAVAGAGKTSTLTHFIQARLADGVPARRMLVLMYNKAAQEDFRVRLSGLIQGAALPDVRTFHSLGLRIYQSLIQQGALPAYESKILSDGEIEGVVWRLLQEIADDDTRQDILSQRRKWVEPAVAFIDLVKAGLSPAADVYEQQDYPAACKIFVELFYRFEDWRRQQRRISYSDMIYDPVMCFRSHPEVADRFSGHMQWILVDEYQDINEVQQSLLSTLHGGRGSVMVIGDPDQTIYEFRGSRPEFIVQRFEQEFGQVTTYQLPHTFRYGHRLSLLANHLIHHNREREPVTGLSHSSTPRTRIALHPAANEAALTLKIIEDELAQREASEIAVIHRVWALCAPVELALLKAGVPYQLDHSQSVLERWELRIFWLLLEIASGSFARRSQSAREESWLHILTTPFPKIRRAELEATARRVAVATDHFGEALLAAIPEGISQWQKQQLEVRAQLIASAETADMKAWRLLKDYMDLTELEKGIEDAAFSAQQTEDRLQTIKAFLWFVRDTDLNCEDMLAHWKDLLGRLKEQRRQLQQGVVLTSAHKSKGREWDVVIVPGLNAHFFPYAPEGEFMTPASVESERRLLYVSMTRARSQLHLMAPSGKATNPQDRDKASMFEREMAFTRTQDLMTAVESEAGSVALRVTDGPVADWLPAYLEHLGAASLKLTMATPAAPPATVSRTGGVVERKFDQVRRLQHETFGEGTLISLDESYIKVRFDGESRVRTLSRSVVEPLIRFL